MPKALDGVRAKLVRAEQHLQAISELFKPYRTHRKFHVCGGSAEMGQLGKDTHKGAKSKNSNGFFQVGLVPKIKSATLRHTL